MNYNKALLIVLVILLCVCVFFGWQNWTLNKEVKDLRQKVVAVHLDEKIIAFEKIFIEKVLKADKEIDFETRLQLENAVRDLHDNDILAQWQDFVDSKNEEEAQNNVKNLLALLVEKSSEK